MRGGKEISTFLWLYTHQMSALDLQIAEEKLTIGIVIMETLNIHSCPYITEHCQSFILGFGGKAIVGTLRTHVSKVDPFTKLEVKNTCSDIYTK